MPNDKKEYKKNWDKENRDRIREYHRAWRQRNRDKIKEYNQKFYEKKTGRSQGDS